VLSTNLYRRHLTAEQKRELIRKVLKTDPKQSDRRVATQTKADHKTVGAVREKLERRGEIPRLPTRTDTTGRQQPAGKPAKAQPSGEPAPAPPEPAPVKTLQNLSPRHARIASQQAAGVINCLKQFHPGKLRGWACQHVLVWIQQNEPDAWTEFRGTATAVPTDR
jgi:hypothetical protein